MEREIPPIVVRGGLVLVRMLLRAKGAAKFFGRGISSGFTPLARFFLSFAILPVYRALFAFRRRINRWYSPAKNKIAFLLTNRYTIHVAAALTVLVAIVVNFGMTSVRAETFGEKSLLYAIVTNEETTVVEEYALTDGTGSQSATSYLNNGAVAESATGAPSSALALESGASLSGGGSFVAPTISSSATSTAPREGNITYTVATGDTISSIASRFGVSISTVLWANNLGVRSTLRPGQTLTILPVSGVQHSVKNGDTLLSIAKKYGVSADEIVAFNSLPSSSNLKIGQVLIIPGGQLVAAPQPASKTLAVKSIFTPAPSGSGSTSTRAAGSKMLWPATGGTVVRGLSWYHTGVDIDCDGHRDGTSTQDNFAAADGIVKRAGWYGGYGNSIDIDHGNGVMTRYGHFHTLYVKTGDSVSSGQALGRCGSTGNSTGTHLHFEVFVNGVRKNPLDYVRYK